MLCLSTDRDKIVCLSIDRDGVGLMAPMPGPRLCLAFAMGTLGVFGFLGLELVFDFG